MTAKYVEAAIFDMDGLMLDSEPLGTKAWQQAVASYVFCLTDEINFRLIGRDAHDADEILRAAYGAQFPTEDVRRLAGRTYAQLAETKGIPIKPGLWELLHYLDAEGIPGAVATSTARCDCLRHLERADLLSRFRVIVCGDEVDRGKPFPDLFLKAAQLLGVQPARCVVLEDSFPGIRAASAGGMIPIMVPDLMEPDEETHRLADAVVSDLYRAKAVIRNLVHGEQGPNHRIQPALLP
jgi:HAD superfamily hydrolase (TIGR01509 family)